MKIAIYTNLRNSENLEFVKKLLALLKENGIEIILHRDMVDFLSNQEEYTFFEDLFNKQDADFVFSIGGDGTLLNTLTIVKDSGIPVLGINTGRLGFLSSIAADEIDKALSDLKNKKFNIERRNLLQLNSRNALFGDIPFALNEVVALKRDTSTMVVLHVYVNEEFLNTYWADGLIIATPTGSTAYSLSCGGPIVLPDSGNFVITPISPHNLNVRPLVIPDKSVIRIKMEGRSENFLLGLDSRSEILDAPAEITVQKADFGIHLLRFDNYQFMSTLRNKLNWGLDSRN